MNLVHHERRLDSLGKINITYEKISPTRLGNHPYMLYPLLIIHYFQHVDAHQTPGMLQVLLRAILEALLHCKVSRRSSGLLSFSPGSELSVSLAPARRNFPSGLGDGICFETLTNTRALIALFPSNCAAETRSGPSEEVGPEPPRFPWCVIT